MKYLYMYENILIVRTNDIKPLNEVYEIACNELKFNPNKPIQLDETKIKCYQLIY